jgi:predicted AAA+ superfamily ATPase
MKKETLKEIIISNREFINNKIQNIISREYIHIPKTLKKVIIFYGVRRSGKTFILTYEQDDNIKIENINIEIIPVYKWLLQK